MKYTSPNKNLEVLVQWEDRRPVKNRRTFETFSNHLKTAERILEIAKSRIEEKIFFKFTKPADWSKCKTEEKIEDFIILISASPMIDDCINVRNLKRFFQDVKDRFDGKPEPVPPRHSKDAT